MKTPSSLAQDLALPLRYLEMLHYPMNAVAYATLCTTLSESQALFLAQGQEENRKLVAATYMRAAMLRSHLGSTQERWLQFRLDLAQGVRAIQMLLQEEGGEG